MAVREKTREQRPSEPAKSPRVVAATRAPAPDARAASKRPLADAHKGDPAARARASIAMQKQGGNARTSAMMSATEVSPKPPVKISVAPPTVVKVPTTSPAVTKPGKDSAKPVVTTQVNVTPAKPEEQTAGPATTPEKEKPDVADPTKAPKSEPAEAPAKTTAPETAKPAPEGEKKEA